MDIRDIESPIFTLSPSSTVDGESVKNSYNLNNNGVMP